MGSNEGECVGVNVGEGVGSKVGDGVGRKVGAEVGASLKAVGRRVRFLFLFFLGASVSGAGCVGAAVGAQVCANTGG